MPAAPHRRTATGRAAEDAAAEHLAARGLRLVARNVRAGSGELDLVVADARTLVFVEVRAREAGALVDPLESIDGRKRGRIISAARAWLAENPLGARDARFDVVAVTLDATGAPAALEHLEGAFDATRL